MNYLDFYLDFYELLLFISFISQSDLRHNTLPWVSSPQFRENELNFLQDSHSLIACEAYALQHTLTCLT